MPLFGPDINAISVSNSLFSSGTVRVTGGPNVTVGSDASGASVSGAFPGIIGASASNSVFTSGTFRITGGPHATVGSDASGASISVDANPNLAGWRNFEQQDAIMLTHIAGISKTPFYFGEQLEGDLTLNQIGLKMSAVTANTLVSMTAHFGVYSKVNSSSASLLGSVSDTFNVSSGSSVSFSGIRNWVLTSPGTHTAISTLSAGDYVFGMMFSAGATASMNLSLFGAGGSAAVTASAPMGVVRPGANQLSTVSTQGFMPLAGRGITTVNALPANVVASEILNQGSGTSAMLRPWMHIRA